MIDGGRGKGRAQRMSLGGFCGGQSMAIWWFLQSLILSCFSEFSLWFVCFMLFVFMFVCLLLHNKFPVLFSS